MVGSGSADEAREETDETEEMLWERMVPAVVGGVVCSVAGRMLTRSQLRGDSVAVSIERRVDVGDAIRLTGPEIVDSSLLSLEAAVEEVPRKV